MLNVRSEQITVFNDCSLRHFEDEMVVHSREFSPRLCEVIGGDQLRVVLQEAIHNAGNYQLTSKGPVQFYIDLVFLFGSHFDTDPLFSQFSNILNDDSNQMFRAEQLYERTALYLDKVHGPDNVNVRRALESLSAFAHAPMKMSEGDFEEKMLGEIKAAFPQRAAYVGDNALVDLIEQARANAARHGFPALRGDALMVIIMFAFGHRCTQDPLYPWISQTLADEKIKDPAARAERLEKKALTWLDHVLASGKGRIDS